MNEQDYLELLEYLRLFELRDPWDRTPFAKETAEECKQLIKQYQLTH